MRDAVHVRYWFTDHLDEEAVGALNQRLSASEQSRCASFVFPRDRRDFAAAHVLLREALSMQGDRAPHEWTFTTDQHGKPRLAPDSPGLQFNLSHTHGLVACAVTRGVDVGIDVEQIRDGIAYEELYDRYFCGVEVADLKKCLAEARAARFIEFWTLKEAYIKAVGRGLSLPLNSFGFSFSGSSTLMFEPSTETDAAEWQFGLFAPSSEYRMALAVHSGVAGAKEIVTYLQPNDYATSCLLRGWRVPTGRDHL